MTNRYGEMERHLLFIYKNDYSDMGQIGSWFI